MSSEKIVGGSFAFRERLNEKQIADLDIGLSACTAFWTAALGLSSYEVEHLRPHGRCIYASLAVLDILHKLGRNDAFVQKVGLDVRQYGHDMTTVLNGLRIGDAAYRERTTERRWNAHLLVRLGDVFIDPTIAQARRPWNSLPHFSAMINAAPADFEIDIGGKWAKTKATWVQQTIGSFVQTTYFDLPREQDIKTRAYMKAPDAKPEARKDVVREALNIISQSNEISVESENTA